MRSTKEAGNDFVFEDSLHCYFSINNNGNVKQLPHINKGDRKKLALEILDAIDGKVKIYCTWTGRYKTDLFEVDNLNEMFDAFM